MKFAYAFLFLALSTSYCVAQKQGNQWYFGITAGLDFNSGTPVPITTSAINTSEGSASICSGKNGRVLFYTDGTTVYDSTNNQMLNGYGLGGNASTTQSALIVPKPGNCNLYYIFTLPADVGYGGQADSGLNYNVVDMSLNGGLGAVTTLDVPLIAEATEKLCGTVANNGTDIWVVAHQWNTDAFYAYLITNAGISAPVISHTGIVHKDVGSGNAEEAIGYMKISPDGSRLALACWVDLNTVQIFDFNNSTGVVSNPITDTNYPNTSGSDGPYGLAFSPDNSKLYVNDLDNAGTSYIYQYNLQAGNDSEIVASRTTVASTPINFYGALQIGPDGKIYVAKYGAYYLDVIENPNGLGALCNYSVNALSLGSNGQESTLGLQNMVDNYLNPPFNITSNSATVCSGQSITLTASASGFNYIWSPASSLNSSTGDSVIATPTIQTTYTATGTDSSGCNVAIDTDVVSVAAAPDKPTLSQHDSVLTTNATQGIQWSRNDSILPGATNQDYTITIAGWYKVVVINPANGCSATSDSVYFSPTSGVNQLTVESGQVTVYPNPTGGEIFVNINSSVAEVRDWNLQVTDVLGRTVFTKSPLNPLKGTFEIDISNLSSGMYFISVVTKTGRVVVPVVKE